MTYLNLPIWCRYNYSYFQIFLRNSYMFLFMNGGLFYGTLVLSHYVMISNVVNDYEVQNVFQCK